MKENCKKINLKRKCFSRGSKKNYRYKRFKKATSTLPDPFPAIKVEFDPFAFTDSDDEGLKIEFSDDEENVKGLVALTQDYVVPFFKDEASYDESKLQEALIELRYKTFRPYQKETIKRILFGRSTLFISPTGSGKSLCYQLPALLFWRYRKYITIVVSPLISLMEDQLSNFPTSMKAVCLHSGNNSVQRRQSIGQLVNGEAQVVFISPEAIVGGVLSVDDLKNMPPVGFVCIDEAHCLSQWSHNFRPAYLQFFKVLNEQMCIKTYLGLTATATKATAFAIARSLTINPETDVIGSTKIPENLILSVTYETNKERALIELLKSPTFKILPSIIIYCNRREETEKLAQLIRISMQNYATLIEVPTRRKSTSEQDKESTSAEASTSASPTMKLFWKAEAYHAGLTSETRKRIQKKFIKGETRVVVATIAFGMGINKANIRAVIHYDMPSSFESYVQEIGRAGRDGKTAQCHMFLTANRSDLYYQQRNIYASITEKYFIPKLTEYFNLFHCRCPYGLAPSEQERLDKLNQTDPPEVTSCYKSNFFNVEKNDNQDDDDSESLEDYNILCNDEKAKQQSKYIHKSVVKKHRACNGHDISIPIEKVTYDLNLRVESVMTLICQIEQAYPQLKIKQFSPAKSECTIFCYQGAEQMKKLSKSVKIVELALRAYQIEHGSDCDIPQELTFDLIPIASKLGFSLQEAIRMLKKSEWELVEKTGRFRKTNVRVRFGGNSFHLRTVCDLQPEEINEINEFLIDYTKSYEQIEKNRIVRVFETFKSHCVDMNEIDQRLIRLRTSDRLKTTLNSYFESPPNDQSLMDTSTLIDENCPKMDEILEFAIRKATRLFLADHCQDITPRAIARIFQGISTPKYPAEHWHCARKWWRSYLDVDFTQMSRVISLEALEARSKGEKPKNLPS